MWRIWIATAGTTEELIKVLTKLKEQHKVKPRDWHEIGALAAIAHGEDPTETVRQRLTQLYIACTRNWKEAQAFECLPLDSRQPAQVRIVQGGQHKKVQARHGKK